MKVLSNNVLQRDLFGLSKNNCAGYENEPPKKESPKHSFHKNLNKKDHKADQKVCRVVFSYAMRHLPQGGCDAVMGIPHDPDYSKVCFAKCAPARRKLSSATVIDAS